jgi:RteC protein
MMDIKRFEKSLSELEQELSVFEGQDYAAAERWRQALPMIDKVIGGIKEKVLANEFAVESEEIYFFKHIKPKLYALRLYENLLYRFNANLPTGTDEMLRQYYQQELLANIRELQTDGYHYQYYKSGSRELDAAYFLRSGTGGDIPVIELNEALPGFSTPLDFTFARFMAYERMQEHVLGLLAGSVHLIKKTTDKNTLKWTGESINLVELAYGIWLTGQLNNGNASISQIVEWLEINFQVNIGLAYRRWWSISKRKRISVTKFIDQMKAAVLKRVDEENGMK